MCYIVVMDTQLKKGVLDLLVLAQLQKEDRYGYDLTDILSQEMEVSAGTLYLVLKRLKDDGYVSTYLKESPAGPARKYYHLSPVGELYYEQRIDEWQKFIKKVGKLL